MHTGLLLPPKPSGSVAVPGWPSWTMTAGHWSPPLWPESPPQAGPPAPHKLAAKSGAQCVLVEGGDPGARGHCVLGGKDTHACTPVPLLWGPGTTYHPRVPPTHLCKVVHSLGGVLGGLVGPPRLPGPHGAAGAEFLPGEGAGWGQNQPWDPSTVSLLGALPLRAPQPLLAPCVRGQEGKGASQEWTQSDPWALGEERLRASPHYTPGKLSREGLCGGWPGPRELVWGVSLCAGVRRAWQCPLLPEPGPH